VAKILWHVVCSIILDWWGTASTAVFLSDILRFFACQRASSLLALEMYQARTTQSFLHAFPLFLSLPLLMLGAIMISVLTDCFVVYEHADGGAADPPEDVEHELTSCATYEEAHKLKQALERQGRHCIIRYLGPAGGGD
jgi:hypothetical protein